MKRFYALLLTLLALLLTTTSCHKEKHFITDKEYRAQVHADFLERQELAAGRADALFAGMDTLDAETREAMEFLYAYMPYSDLADYDQSFYLQQVRAAFAARERFSWGSKIPEDIFRHFVLVYRVNPRQCSMIAIASAAPSVGSVPAPSSSNSTSERSSSCSSTPTILTMWEENVERD